jgi:hypothetical protein
MGVLTRGRAPWQGHDRCLVARLKGGGGRSSSWRELVRGKEPRTKLDVVETPEATSAFYRPAEGGEAVWRVETPTVGEIFNTFYYGSGRRRDGGSNTSLGKVGHEGRDG